MSAQALKPVPAYEDGTLRLEDGRVRMIGVSRSVAELVPLLEDSSAFDGAAFFAPTVRVAGGDRFHIEAAAVAELEPVP